MKILLILVSLLVSVLTFCLTFLLIFYIRRSRSTDIFHRLRRHNVVDIRKEAESDDLLRKFYRFVKKTAKPAKELSFSQFLDLKLRQAGLPLLGAEFIVIALIGAAVAGIIIYMLTLNRNFSIIIASLVPIALWITLLVLINRRRTAFTEQLGDCLTTVSNALRAGYSFQQAMTVVAKEMEPPISEEFAHVTNDVSKGLSLENALTQMNKRVNSSDFDLVVTAVLIQREVGGNLAQILDSISDTINDRIRMKREILTLTAQGRFSAIVLAALPFAAAGMMYTMNHDNFMMLFEEPMGQIALGVSLVMIVVGFIVIRRIVDIDA